MIKFKDYCENITEKEYRAADRRSYSFLKELDEKGPRIIRDGMEFKSSAGLTLGSIVDAILDSTIDFDPHEEYHISDLTLDVSGTTHPSKIIKYLNMNKIKLTIDDEELLLDICKDLGFKKNPKFDDKFWEQVDLLNIQIDGKQVVSNSELNLAIHMADILKNHEFTTHIFNPPLEIEVVDQAVIFFKLFGVECKGMLDKVCINHELKIIYPIDIKTGADDFMSNFWRYKYYLQGAMYTAAIQSLVQTIPELDGYKVAPFQFVYISRKNPDVPLIYEMTNKFVENAFRGWISNSGRDNKGIEELVNDYKWYIENQEFDLKRDIIENNGVIELKAPM